MKVKELIEQLQKLDQEKEIWIIYDSHLPIRPEVDIVKTEAEARYYNHYYNHYCDGEGIKVGDYTISC